MQRTFFSESERSSKFQPFDSLWQSNSHAITHTFAHPYPYTYSDTYSNPHPNSLTDAYVLRLRLR